MESDFVSLEYLLMQHRLSWAADGVGSQSDDEGVLSLGKPVQTLRCVLSCLHKKEYLLQTSATAAGHNIMCGDYVIHVASIIATVIQAKWTKGQLLDHLPVHIWLWL